MDNYVLSGCSTADISKEHFERRDISYICFHYFMDDVAYPDDLGQTISFPEFYEKMRQGAVTRTSQINIDEFMDYFTPFLEQGKDILHMTLSSGLSGVYNSAKNAAEILMEKYPDRKIIIIDSLGASSGFGLLLDMAADLRDEGKDMEEVAEWLLQNRLKMHHWFFSTDLTFYVKGGRISKAAGLFGTAFKICPVLNVSNEGKLIPRQKVRGKNKAIEKVVDMMEQHAQGGIEYSGKCYICHSDCIEDAQAVRMLVLERFPNIKGDIEIYSVGTTIGSHTGPGTVALFFMGDERID